MNIIITWILTTLASTLIELANESRIFKDLADNGYKVNIDRLSQIQNMINNQKSKEILFSLIIPIYNIIGVFHRSIQYNEIRPMLLDQLNTLGTLEEMTKEEKDKYSKKKTALNAIIICINSNLSEVKDDYNNKPTDNQQPKEEYKSIYSKNTNNQEILPNTKNKAKVLKKIKK